MSETELHEALEACLDAVADGLTPEAAVARFPGVEAELLPLVEQALRLGAVAPFPAGRREALRADLVAEAAALYPPGGVADPEAGAGRGPWLILELVVAGLGLVALWLVLTRPHPGAPPPSASSSAAATERPTEHVAPTATRSAAPLALATASPATPGATRFTVTPTPPPVASQTATTGAGAPVGSPGSSAGGSGAGTLHGVTRDDARRPLSALVTAVGSGGRFSVKASDDGAYRLSVPAGSYVVSAQAGGYRGVWYPGVPTAGRAQPVTVAPGASVRVDFELTKEDEYPPPGRPSETPAPTAPPEEATAYPGPPQTTPAPTRAPPYP